MLKLTTGLCHIIAGRFAALRFADCGSQVWGQTFHSQMKSPSKHHRLLKTPLTPPPHQGRSWARPNKTEAVGETVPGEHQGLWCPQIPQEVHQICQDQWHLAVHGFVALELIHELRHGKRVGARVLQVCTR